MKTSWQMQAGLLACQWSEAGERIHYNPPEFQEASRSISKNVPSSVTNFAEHSPFGSGEWYVPWNARWHVPNR
jgi:hypothetical protein